MNYVNSVDELIGNTPIVKLNKVASDKSLKSNIFAKVESFNPGGSIKDRIAKAMIMAAIEDGILKEGTTIIEPTSGNTGIGIALVGAAMGFKVQIVMPETMSLERRQLISAYGAEIILSEGSKGMKGAIAKAEELRHDNPNSITLGQFDNMENPKEHYRKTAVEIYEAMDGKIDAVVMGVGTGGTISGVGKYLKELNKDVQIVAVEPVNSPVLTKDEAGPHKIQGIGAGFVPDTLDTEIYNEVVLITDEEAYEYTRYLARTEGILSGISSGAALAAALKVAEESDYENIVVVLPDTGERYLSTGVFD